MTSATLPADALLTNGDVVTIRPVLPTDEADLVALYERTDADSLRLRFFTYSKVAGRRDVEHMIEPASKRHAGYVVVERDTICGIGCVEHTDDPATAEFAMLVDDRHHGEGVGTLLLEHLIAAARMAGYRRMRANVLPENTAMLNVLRDLGASTHGNVSYGVVEIEFDLSETTRWQTAIRDRESIAEFASVDRLLSPKTVAVIGVGSKPSSVGRRLIEQLRAAGYTGAIYAVNRTGDSVSGVPASTSLADLPERPDLALIAVPAAGVKEVVDDCARRGVYGAVIVSDGFAELGDEGTRLQSEILAIARRSGMRLIGPNCLGVINTDPAVRLNATFAVVNPPGGSVGIATQSGGVGLAMLEHLSRTDIGVSTFVSMGNKADISGNDLLMYWERDPKTKICMLYLESFGNARKFARIAARVARTKPIVAITAGRSVAGARGVRSHTAAAATPNVAVDALFAQAGVIGATSMSAAMDIVSLLDAAPLPRGRRVGIVSNGGGPGALAADACIAAGLDLPELSPTLRGALAALLPAHAATSNPIDTTAGGGPQTLSSVASTLLDSGEVDTVMVVHTALTTSDRAEATDALARIATDRPDRPLVAILLGHAGEASQTPRGSQVPTFGFPEPAADAIAAVTRYAEWKAAEPSSAPRLHGLHRGVTRRLVDDYLRANPDGGWLDTDNAAALVSSYGIPVVDTQRATSAADAVSIARRLSYPVVVKAADGAMLHRTELGGVRTGLDSDEAVKAAVSEMRDRLGPDCPIVVQPMLPAGVETAVGVVSDPTVGPIVMVAMGGVATDLLADRSFRLPPIDRRVAHAQIQSLRAEPLLSGYRGSPPTDVAGLEEVLMRVSLLATEIPELADLDLNPVIVTPDGAVAVDVKVRIVPVGTGDPLLRRLPRRGTPRS